MGSSEDVLTPRPGRARGLRLLIQRSSAWVLREAETPSGALGMAGIAFVGSAFIPIFLEPLLIVLTAGIPRLWRRFALLFAVGSIVGGIVTYVIGYAFVETVGQAVVRFWGAEESWNYLLSVARGRWGVALVAAIALGPGPYKLVTMAAGATEMPFALFVAILVAGRTARFLAVAWMSKWLGPRVGQLFVSRRVSAAVALCAALVALGVITYFLVIHFTR